MDTQPTAEDMSIKKITRGLYVDKKPICLDQDEFETLNTALLNAAAKSEDLTFILKVGHLLGNVRIQFTAGSCCSIFKY